MSRIYLVSLRSPFLDDDRVFPPIGVMQLKSCLDEAGHETFVDDDFDFDRIERYADADVVAFSVMTPQGAQAETARQRLRALAPRAKLVIGGPHALHYTEQVLPHDWDHIVRGDGERDLVRIANGETLDRVLSDQLTEEEMNATPLPWRDAKWLHRYQYKLDGRPGTTMLTTRGCPMGCAFCEDRRTKVRHYTPRRVERELEQITAAGFGSVMFFDDIFAMIPKRTQALTDVLRPFKLAYRCFAHANTLREDMARMMAETGCVEVGFGCEHASQKILDVIGKGVKAAQNEELLARCKRYGIRVKAFFIVGLPGEDQQTLLELERFIARHVESGALHDFDLSVYFPYRGTLIRDQISEYDMQVTGDLDAALGYYKGQSGAAEVVIRTAALSAEDIRSAKEYLYRRYNRRFAGQTPPERPACMREQSLGAVVGA